MNKVIPVLLFLLVCSACSSVKLMDSWKSENFQSSENQKILVAAKSPELAVRKSYETAIANQLKSQGITAVAIHQLFPDFKDKETPTEDEVITILNTFKAEGITSILVTSLKETITTKNDNTPQRAVIPTEYRNKSFFSFNSGDNVYDLPKLAPLGGGEVPKVVLTSTTYILEAITYDITQEKDNQLVHVSLVEVTDPNSGKKILNQFSKIVSNQFKK